MSLSRLTPRRSRQGITRQRRADSERKSDGTRHLSLWEAIRRTREELNQWQQQVDQVDRLFNQFILPREQTLTHEVSNISELLIQHFAKDELDTPDRSLLGLWITENLQSLQGHPFASVQRTQTLTREWRTLISKEGAIEYQLSRMARNMEVLSETDPVSAQPVDQKHSGASIDEQTSESASSDTADDASVDQTAGSAQDCASGKQKQSDENAKRDSQSRKGAKEQSVEEKISVLESKLSVDRLFRQLAKALHPDKEQDETLRSQKHVLMSQCLKARKNKDINTLLTLYCQYVGELPDDLHDDSQGELIAALEEQLKQLQFALRQARFGDPLHTMIVERYSSSDTQLCEKRINDHAASLDSEISAMQRLSRQLNTHEGLLDSLDERRAVEQDRLAIDEMTGSNQINY